LNFIKSAENCCKFFRATDKNPTHQKCLLTWCKYLKAQAKGANYTHKGIPEAVMDAVKPTFDALADEKLLEKCFGGYTKNPNEGLNALIWRIVPKTVYVGKKTVEVAVNDAVLVFNDGQGSRVRVLEGLGITAGKYLVRRINAQNKRRIQHADVALQQSSKEARTARRKALGLANQEDEPSYVQGGF